MMAGDSFPDFLELIRHGVEDQFWLCYIGIIV